MASASSIGKLHQQKPQIAELTQPAQFKSANFADSQPDLLAMQTAAWQFPARRRFGPQGRLAAPPMMNSIAPIGVPEGRNSFAALAARETAQAMRAALTRRYSQQAQRGAAGHPQHGPLAIQL